MLISEKPAEEYVNEVKENEVKLEGEGFNIRKTVDVANGLKEKGYKVENITISTIKKDERNISKMEIVMKK